MNRRDVLKLGGAATLALLLQASPLSRVFRFPSEAQARGLRYRGTPDGRIYSTGDGKTWDFVVNFGTDYSIRKVSADLSGNVYAQLQYAGHNFNLVRSTNSTDWRTV